MPAMGREWLLMGMGMAIYDEGFLQTHRADVQGLLQDLGQVRKYKEFRIVQPMKAAFKYASE